MEDIKLYDFKKNEKFSLENIRQLSLMCEEFCKTSNMQISYETKNEGFKFTVNKCMQTKYGEFIENLEGDNIVIEYNILPLVDNLTLFINKSVVLSIVDLLLGGNGKIENLDREPTNIDLELLKYLFENLLQRIYIPYNYETINVSRIYTNKAQYQKINNKDMIFTSLINVSLENKGIGNLIFCIPYESMKDVINDFGNYKINKSENLEEDRLNHIESSEIFDFIQDVEIDICASIGSTRINVNDLINLGVGDVIILDQKINDNITISVGDANIYKAKPGVSGVKKAVEITEIIGKER